MGSGGGKAGGDEEWKERELSDRKRETFYNRKRKSWTRFRTKNTPGSMSF